MRWISLFVILLVSAGVGNTQLPSFNLGRSPSADEIRAQDITVGPSGKELPAGRGTAKEGGTIFEKRCAHCHGVNGASDGQFPALTGAKARVVNYPFATTIWDFIYSGMPRRVPDIGTREGTLTPSEAYALTAFVLYHNNIIKETDVLDAASLPKVKMPKRDPHLDKVAPR